MTTMSIRGYVRLATASLTGNDSLHIYLFVSMIIIIGMMIEHFVQRKEAASTVVPDSCC